MAKRHKLGLSASSTLAVVGAPTDLALEIPHGCKLVTGNGEASVVLVFVESQKHVAAAQKQAALRGGKDAALWFAYPKGGQRGTDLNRDVLARALSTKALEAVSIVSFDETWSALRVKHAPALKAKRVARGSGLTVAATKRASAKKTSTKKASTKKASAKAPTKKAPAKKAPAKKAR